MDHPGDDIEFHPGRCLEDELEFYSKCVEEQTYILDNKTDYRALLACLGWMPITCLMVQDLFHDCDQIPIHDTEHLWYNEMCELCFPTFLPSSWHEFQLPPEWDDQAPDVLTWECRGLARLFHAFSVTLHQN